MASEYNLALKATLDTSQVQQELQRLKHSYTAGSDDGNSFSKGAPGVSHMQKVEVQLTKLNSAISGLQRSIEQLAKQQQRQSGTASPAQTAGTAGNVHGSGTALPIAPGKPGFRKAAEAEWLKSKQYRDLNRQVSEAYAGAVKAGLMKANSPLLTGLGTNEFFHNLIQSNYFQGLTGFDADNYRNLYNKWYKEENALRHLKQQQASARQTRQIATLIGGQLFGGIGSYATDFGYTRTGALVSGLGSGVTAGGGAALGATMMGAGASAATGVGLAVGVVTAAAAITKAFMELEESAKKAAEAQDKIAEALRSNAIGQSLDMYGMWQKQRAEEVQKQNNLTVAKERADYFKAELEKARANFYLVGDPVKYEKKIREDAEKKKNSAVDDFYVQGSMQTGFKEVHFQRARTDEEKAAIDKAANEAIEAQQKKLAAAKRELQAAEANAQTWKEVADKLEESKKAGEKLARERLNEEAARRNALVRQSSDLKYRFKEEESVRSTQIFANDVLNQKNGPLPAFNALAEELDRLRAERRDLRSQAFSINRDMELNGKNKTALDLKDMARRRDYLLHRSDVLGERVDVLETALGNIDVSRLAHKPDLSHVTSLAQYGFNMGEKDDGVERMEKYYTKSLNLQQQIKDKIQEGIKTEAVYSL